MSQQARQNLAPEDGAGANKDSKRKMTQAIIDEEENAKKNKKDAYDFLEDDDDFEEFEIQGEGAAEDDMMMIDTSAVALSRMESEKKQW